MSNEAQPRCIPLSDVVDPDQFRCEVASVELSALRDDQILAAQLDAPDLSRARQILARAGGLNPLTRMGLPDHRALDLSATESARLFIAQGLMGSTADASVGVDVRGCSSSSGAPQPLDLGRREPLPPARHVQP